MSNTEKLVSYLEQIVAFHAADKSKAKNRHNRHELDDEPELLSENVRLRHQEMLKHQEQRAKDEELQHRNEYVALMGQATKAFSKHPLFQPYQFHAADLDVVAQIYHQTASNFDADVRAPEIIKMSPCIENKLKSKVNFITSLVDREILSFDHTRISNFRDDIHVIIEGHFVLNAYLLNLLMGRNPIQEADEFLANHLCLSSKPFKTLSKAMKIHFFAYRELISDRHEHDGFYYGSTVHALLDMMLNHIDKLPMEHPLRSFISSHQLCAFDVKCLLIIQFFKTELDIEMGSVSLANLLSQNAEEYEDNFSAIQHSRLIEEGLIIIEPDYHNSLEIHLTEEGEAELNMEVKKSSSKADNNLETLLLRSKLLSKIDTKQRLEQLILPEEDLELLSSTIHRLKHPERFDLSRWGLLSASLSSDSDALSGCNILLHGHPGTGKTFIAGVLANELGRPLVMINANNIRDSYYGNTEKNARKLFKQMRDIIKNVQPAPVFLLNEGDQLIHKRKTEREQSCDSTENAIQSIFLEEMETFPGILIVTTNLVNNMDVAMSRRFHYKLELHVPDTISRQKLWNLHLPATIPGSENIDTHSLAERFCFTGGQIRIVVQNACYQAMLRGENATLSQADLSQYAELEDYNSFEVSEATTSTNISRIGFVINHKEGYKEPKVSSK